MYNNNNETIGILPMIPLRGILPINNNELRIDVGREKSLTALKEAEEKYNDHIVLGYQNDFLIENPLLQDINKFATVAKITMKIKLPNGGYKVKFKTIARVEIQEDKKDLEFFLCVFKTIKTVIENKEHELALTRLLIPAIIDNLDVLFDNKDELVKMVQKGVNTDQLVDRVSSAIKILPDKKVKYLEESSIEKRIQFLLEDIEIEKQIRELENKISATVKRNVDENQKEYFLREKLKAIHEELGDKAKKESEIEELKELAVAKGMPKEAEEKLLKEISKYAMLPQSSGESGVTRTYIDWMLSIPWTEKTKDVTDLKKVEKILNENHYGLDKVKERILEYIAVKTLTKKNPATILCLVGPPGVGKTSIAKSIAKALNKKYIKIALGGVKDESEIRGHRRTYLGSMPGRIIQSMKKAEVVNPLFLLDEIDKMASDYKGDPASAMLEVLDPEQNKIFSDHYLEENYDLSEVLFVTTANYIGNIPPALKDRMEVIHLSSYTEYEKLNIAKEYLVERQLKEHGLTNKKFEVSDEAILTIIRHYTREAGVRQLERLIGALVRKTVTKVLRDKEPKISVTNDNLESFLDKKIFNHNLADEKDVVGVVTGLAYTQYGGDTLPVEVTHYSGKGGLTLTGKLGDVMKESAQTALSYVKTNAKEYNIDPKFFVENNIHIHVPEGAVPKDGPSAGVTMVTAILSALTNKVVNKEVGMTGEVTLRGRVLAIGGVKEKSIAAHRSGLKKILIPKENEKDIDDIPKSVRDKLQIEVVSQVDDIFPHIFK